MRYRICTDYNITDKEGVEGAESPPFPNGGLDLNDFSQEREIIQSVFR